MTHGHTDTQTHMHTNDSSCGPERFRAASLALRHLCTVGGRAPGQGSFGLRACWDHDNYGVGGSRCCLNRQ
eukprot:12575540-Alexandrium_andersonii.AAC.1